MSWPLAAAELALNRDIRWASSLPAWLAAVITLVGIGAVAWIYAHEASFVSRRWRALLALLRIAAFGLLLLMVAQPVIEQSRTAPPRLVLLLDQSDSMTTRDVPGGMLPGGKGVTGNVTRAEAWKTLLTVGDDPLVGELAKRFAVKAIPIADKVGAVIDDVSNPDWLKAVTESEAEAAEGTRLGDAIDFAARQLDGPRPAAVILLSDGVNTAGLPLPEASARARNAGVPVYAVALGSDRPRPDSAIENVVAEQVVFPGDRLQVEVTVGATSLVDKPASLTMKNRESGETFARTELRLPADGQPQLARLALRPTTPGPLPLELQLEPQSDEQNTDNNAASLTLDVRKEPIRTLLVDSTPTYEYRALKSLLERDPAIALRVRLQDADPEYPAVDAAAIAEFPASRDDLFTYDVIILGDVDPQLLPRAAWPNLRDFVSQEAGGLILIAGPRFMPQALRDIEPMQPLLPVTLPPNQLRASAAGGGEAFRIQPTKFGLQEPSLMLGETIDESAAIWRELPPVQWLLKPVEPKLGVQILAVAEPVQSAERNAPSENSKQSSPAILRRYVGAGEVLMHATDETWRWRWRSDDRYFARYWGQAVRRLARGRAVRGHGSLTSNRSKYAAGEPVTLQARLRLSEQTARDHLAIELDAANQPTRELQLTRRPALASLFETELRDLPPDHYTARVMTAKGAVTTEFTVEAPPTEMSRLNVNTAGLKDLAQQTGGKFYTVPTVGDLLDQLPPATPTVVERLPDQPLWNRPWLLATLCLLLASEWLIRRRHGML